MMSEFRHNSPSSINGSRVVIKKDYADLKATDLTTGKVSPMDFPDHQRCPPVFPGGRLQNFRASLRN